MRPCSLTRNGWQVDGGLAKGVCARPGCGVYGRVDGAYYGRFNSRFHIGGGLGCALINFCLDGADSRPVFFRL